MSGVIKIGDFGLVTAVEKSGHAGMMEGGHTPTALNPKHTSKVGTTPYMSPEQVRTGELFNQSPHPFEKLCSLFLCGVISLGGGGGYF